MHTLGTMWPKDYVFLLTHADSLVPAFASLLCEQLSILGIPGSGLMYRRRLDLARLRWHVAFAHRIWPQGRFLFDAITDNREYIPLTLTSSERLHALVCIRRPTDALFDIQAASPGLSLSEAAEVYCDRLEWLATAGVNLGERALVFPTEMIVRDTNMLLRAIAAHLGIDRDFTVHLPAVPRVHDGSSRDDLQPWGRSERVAPAMDRLILGQCQEAYHYTLIELGERCPSIGLPPYAGDSGTSWLECVHVAYASGERDSPSATLRPEPMWESSLGVAG